MPSNTLRARPHDIIAIARRYAEQQQQQNNNDSNNKKKKNLDAAYPISHYHPREIHSDDDEYYSDYMVNARKKFDITVNGTQHPASQSSPTKKTKKKMNNNHHRLPPLDDDADANQKQKQQQQNLTSSPPDYSSKRRKSYSAYNEASPVPSLSHKNRERYLDEFGLVTANPVVKYEEAHQHHQTEDSNLVNEKDEATTTKRNKSSNSKSPRRSKNTKQKLMMKKEAKYDHAEAVAAAVEQRRSQNSSVSVNNNGSSSLNNNSSNLNNEPQPLTRKRSSSTHEAVGLYSAAPVKHRITENLKNSNYNQDSSKLLSHQKPVERRRSVSMVLGGDEDENGEEKEKEKSARSRGISVRSNNSSHNNNSSPSNKPSTSPERTKNQTEQQQVEKQNNKVKKSVSPVIKNKSPLVPSPPRSSTKVQQSKKTAAAVGPSSVPSPPSTKKKQQQQQSSPSPKKEANNNDAKKKEEESVSTTKTTTNPVVSKDQPETKPAAEVHQEQRHPILFSSSASSPSSSSSSRSSSSSSFSSSSSSNSANDDIKINKSDNNTKNSNDDENFQNEFSASHSTAVFSDLSNVRSYLEIDDDNKVTPQEVRNLLRHLQPSSLLSHWNAAIGKPTDNNNNTTSSSTTTDEKKQEQEVQISNSINQHRNDPSSPLYLISNWIHGQGTSAEHETLMKSRTCRGVAVMSDSAGLSKLSRTKPLLEVLKHIHEPKMIVAKEVLEFVNSNRRAVESDDSNQNNNENQQTKTATARKSSSSLSLSASLSYRDNVEDVFKFDGNFVGNWVADNTASFFPFIPNTNRSSEKSIEEQEREFLQEIIEMMIRAMKKIEDSCLVKIGMGIHFGTFTVLGSPENSRNIILQGHEYEHVEHLAEDFTAGGEIVVTEDTFKKYFAENNKNENNTTASFDVIPRGEGEGDEGEMRGFRVVDKRNNENDALKFSDDDDDFELGGSISNTEPSRPSFKKLLHQDEIAYPAGLSPDFFSFLNKYTPEEILSHHKEVDKFTKQGIFLLVKFRSVEHELLLDQIAQRMYVREEVKMIVDRINFTGQDTSYNSPGVVDLIKCNGDIAIVRADTTNSALRFAFSIHDRFEKIGESFQCSIGAWKGEAFVFDLSYRIRYLSSSSSSSSNNDEDNNNENNNNERKAQTVTTVVQIPDFDVAGSPVNISSKLAEDFGEDGLFFGVDIFSSSPSFDFDAVHKQEEEKEILVGQYNRVRGSAAEKLLDDPILSEKLGQATRMKLLQQKSRLTKVFGIPVKIEKSGVTIQALKLREVVGADDKFFSAALKLKK